MLEPFANDWLRDVIGEGRRRARLPRGSSRSVPESLLLDTICSLKPGDSKRILRPILDFQGTRLMLSCTGRTPLQKILKQVLCLADLVIIVPAPLWVSCRYMPRPRYTEFNFEGIELAGRWNVATGLMNNLSDLFVDCSEAFEDGAVTFLPVPGESLHRWSDPELAQPELPGPYPGQPGRHTSLDAHLDAFYALCSERIAAERLGAMHLNTASFAQPVFGDFTVGKQTIGGQPVRSLMEIGVPDCSVLSLRDVLRIRRELNHECSRLSRAVATVLSPPDEYPQSVKPAIEDVRSSCAALARQVESTLPSDSRGNRRRLPEIRFALGSGGSNGSTMRAVDFLLAGGTLRDLVQLLISPDQAQLQLREDSMLAADFSAG